MQQGDNKPLLWKCVYPNYQEGKINFCDQKLLATGISINQVGLSTEKRFRELAEKNLALIPEAAYNKAWFKQDSIRASGCYWNKSVLIIPIENSRNYYQVSFFS
jgi:hypothetical protein